MTVEDIFVPFKLFVCNSIISSTSNTKTIQLTHVEKHFIKIPSYTHIIFALNPQSNVEYEVE